MPSETERSYLRLAVAASAHSQRFALSGYTLGSLSDEQVFDIGRDLVRLFEQRFEAEIKKAPPGKPEAPCGSFGGARARQRLRDQ
ncbi:hypothetical protein [Pseudotabrizicola alkalilacus]|uniref:Uncharacterized protein n=1 Tax=Pseudotabrizicola alkalilacus TaxID=2305252 RepID=A0A411Z1E5_9RHOB|nr:hypothetical protein [Pseudotabrizicola alkalilacus]RGP36867.1 hypothetical protein D1012_11960 [Pseudotabrizicola alkalilacus]